MAFEHQQPYCTLPHAAAMLGISARTFSRLLDQGALPYITPSNHRRVKRADVIAYRTACQGGAEPATTEHVPYNHLA